MLNNFCFDVWAEKSLFIVENVNDFFWTSSSSPPYPVILEFIELVPSEKRTRDDKMFLMAMFTGCIYTETESNGLIEMVMMNCCSLGSGLGLNLFQKCGAASFLYR